MSPFFHFIQVPQKEQNEVIAMIESTKDQIMADENH
jgi:hypothetical protein